MIIVVADDFSGAAEMAGIGHRFGLSTEIQFKFNSGSKAELIAIDSNTRLMEQARAVETIGKLISEIKTANQSYRLFKKTDSVMRGHIAAEINELQQELGYERVLFIPANPVRGRIIQSGQYFVSGISLAKTVFATDPDFPIATSDVGILLKPQLIKLPYAHIRQGGKLPAKSFITADTETTNDIDNYISQTGDNDLCCGAAECFEAFLKHLGYKSTNLPGTGPLIKKYTIIANGSTVKNASDVALIEKAGIPMVSLPGNWKGDQFILSKEEETQWHEQIAKELRDHSAVAVSVNHPVKQIGGADIFSGYFVALMQYISGIVGNESIHYCLTGGATASAMITGMGIQSLSVKQEVVSGVVTLSDAEDKMIFTVKPGSYPWPAVLIEKMERRER